jgi:hypothetical protein
VESKSMLAIKGHLVYVEPARPAGRRLQAARLEMTKADQGKQLPPANPLASARD